MSDDPARARPLQGPEYVAEMRALNHPAVHQLKTWPPYFGDILDGRKLFEVRKNDRDFRVGDYLDLVEYDMTDGAQLGLHHTGRSLMVCISYILYGGQFGVQDGYCVLGIEHFAAIANAKGESSKELSDTNGGHHADR